MNTPEPPPEPRRRVLIAATCRLHPGAAGYTNLVIYQRGGLIVLDPHAVGACVITLDEDGACLLRDTLASWLG